MKTALIFGIGGQDGSYLADLLLERGYEVHGTHRRSSVDNLSRIRHCLDRTHLRRADLTDYGSIVRVLSEVSPDEIYNEADQDNVGWSKDTPELSVQVTAGGVSRLLEAVRDHCPAARVFQPVSATMFGPTASAPQNESTPLNPQSPYACAKAHAYHLCRWYRKEYGLFVSTGTMYTHDSPRRGAGYLLQELCYKGEFLQTVLQARIDSAVMRNGEPLTMSVGDPDAEVDVGFSGDYMDAAWRILQLEQPDDFIISTGETDRVENIAQEVLRQYGLSGIHVVRDPIYPKSLHQGKLVGDYTKLKDKTGWIPQTSLRQLVKMIREGQK